MGSAKNKLKAGSLLAGTIASAAAVGAQQASANLLSDLWFGKSEDIKPKNEPNTGIGSIFSGLEKVYDASKAALGLYVLKVVAQSNSYTEGLTNVLAAGFKNYAVPVLKVTSDHILDLAGEHPFLAAVTAITTINYFYKNYSSDSVEKNEYDRGKAEGKREILNKLKEESEEEDIIKKAKNVK